MISESKLCFNCDSTPKYKCPTCLIPYCSVICCQKHKLENCTRPAPPPSNEEIPSYQKTNFSYITENTLPLEALEKLRHNAGVKECLTNPHLRHIMSVINNSPDPTSLIAQAMIEPIFVDFATECLKVVQPPEQKEVNSSDED